MIDIIALVLLVRHVRRVAELKQQPTFGIIVSTVAMYVALEIAGVFVGLSFSRFHAIVGGLVGAGLAIALTFVRLRAMRDGRSDGQAPASTGPQLVGAACAVCGKRIFSIKDGSRCNLCLAPCHVDCTQQHAATHPEAGLPNGT